MAAFDWADVEVGPSFHNPIPQPNVQATYQHSSGPDRAELVPPGRFEPYGMPRTWANEYTNAEAGPSTLVQPLAPYFQPPTSQPPGWIPETTADAENSHSITEEEEAQVSNFHRPRIPRVIEWSFGVRCLSKPGPHMVWDHPARTASGNGVTSVDSAIGSTDIMATRDSRQPSRLWLVSTCPAKENDVSDLVDFNAEAAEIIRMLRSRKYQSPRLHLRGGRQAQVQRVWENQERSLFQDLSQYYWLPQGKRSWSRPSLMKKGEHGVGRSMG